VLGSGLAVVAATQASAATGCSVNYQVSNSWPGGFGASFSITNLGDPITSWTLKWTWPSGQTVSQGWNGTFSQSGTTETVTSLSYNGSIATGATASGMGFNGTWTGTNTNPSSFTLNGVTCNGGTTGPTTGPPTTRPPTSAPPSTRPPTSAPPTSRPPTSAPPTTGSPCTTNCPAHVDNPYVGAKGYVNPEWAAEANSESGGSRVSNNSTGIWLDRIAAIAGANGAMGLRAHLDDALTQQTNGQPVVIEFVVYDLPDRDCAALASNGELTVANDGINKYKTQFIDPIAAIMKDSKYASLRIVNVVEDDSLPNLVTNLNIATCAEANSSGAYVQGIQYALNQLHASNIYNYLDIGHHAWLGWDSNFAPAATLMANVARGTTAGFASVDGFIDNTANYGPLQEPYFNINTTVNGTSIRQSTWVDWNSYDDELTYTQAFRNQLISDGFPSTLGMLVDTSRDGWGGSARPTAASTSTDLNTFVNNSRIDRRIHAGNWCNQSGAGLGERPRANPGPAGIDAYVWIKPPGESDGSSTAISNNEGKGFDRMCDPTYGGNALNQNNPTGALANAPLSGHWFSAQFQQLMTNAYPPLS
jgi:cellulose 1,4-beta-cellobiosidase